MEETIENNGTVVETTNTVYEDAESNQKEQETESPDKETFAYEQEEHADAGCTPSDVDQRKKVVSDHIELGKRGERAARAFLERHGLDILDTNWKCPAGEVHIVAWDGYALRFVEVKTRRGTGKGFPEEAVDAEKRSRYERIAEFYLRGFDKVDIPVFFDIIGILATGEGRAFLRYHRDAFGRDYER